jgi:hypothetical protein
MREVAIVWTTRPGAITGRPERARRRRFDQGRAQPLVLARSDGRGALGSSLSARMRRDKRRAEGPESEVDA